MTTQICVSVSAPDVSELIGKVQQAERLTADLIEVRLDRLRSSHGLSKVARSVESPLIATNRPLSEKGSYSGSEQDRLRILQEAAEEGFEYVDLEITMKNLGKATSLLRQKGAKIILSHHDHFRTPDNSGLNGGHGEDWCVVKASGPFLWVCFHICLAGQGIGNRPRPAHNL